MEPKNQAKNVFVETYAEDMAKVIEDDHQGLVKKIIQEEEARANEKKNLSPESKKNRMFMQMSAVLFLLGLGILFFLFLNRGADTLEPVPEFVPLVFTDQSSFLEVAGLKRSEIFQAILNQTRTSTVKPGGLEGIYLTFNKKVVGLRQFVFLLQANFLPSENPVIVSDQFLMGWVNLAGRAEGATSSGFFILLKTRSASDIFGSLRAWEEKMFQDLYEFYGRSAASGNDYLLTKSFEDGIVENKNARQLSNETGDPVLLYVFADNNSVVIADSPVTAREVMLRLAAKQTKE